ncbi:MAG: hypothetical protein QM708_13170 [Propioniciclava sp.]|uniref:hypothetical protein n=1 Tax=Propioniciclava sp. TaxID=2038686 RepID=UPI0039E3A1EE
MLLMLRSLSLVTAGMLIAGCTLAPAGPDTPPASLPRMERHASGGMCPAGPCSSDLVVTPDGSWTLVTQEGETRGQLSPAQKSRLASAYSASPRQVTANPQPPCADARDGILIIYRWESDGIAGSASTCDPALDRSDPLLRALDELADSPR